MNNLRDLVEKLCILRGSFVLTSGLESSYYFDCKRATLDGECLNLIADAFLDEINDLNLISDDFLDDPSTQSPIAIGGLTMGADFITAAVIMRAYQIGLSTIKGSIVRKEPKKHGTKTRIENELPRGTTIVVIDDVITTGKSTAEACERFIDHGYEVTGIIALLDREEGGVQSLTKRFNVPVRSILKKSDFKLDK